MDRSKPPIGGAIFAENPDIEFTEALSIAPNSSATATVLFQPPIPVLNAPDAQFTDLWTLNTNDVNFGVHVVNFIGTAISKKAGPVTANGDALYQYLGCYQDSTNFRIEAKGYVNANQTPTVCARTHRMQRERYLQAVSTRWNVGWAMLSRILI